MAAQSRYPRQRLAIAHFENPLKFCSCFEPINFIPFIVLAMTPITPSHSSSGLRSSARLGEQRADTSRTDPLAVRPAHGYAGDISPQLACQWWQSGEAVLVDVRTDAEREWVGHVPGALPLAWKQWPGMAMNPGFDKGLRAAVPEGRKVVLLCRSGVRSAAAARRASELGIEAYNILEGFEGDASEQGQRGQRGGWRYRGLPWKQD